MKIKDLIKPMVAIGILAFLICCLIKKPSTWDDYASYISYAVSAVTILYILYERWLWIFIPWKRPPILKKHYDGTIYYYEGNESKTKSIDVFVEQRLFSLKITTKTDINSSYTIAASIEQEYENFFLYYTYITNPNASVQAGNPIQHGTCRIVLSPDTRSLRGKYWTTSNTIGDIILQEHTEQNGE